MICPKCKTKMLVYNSRTINYNTVRYVKCPECKYVTKTVEVDFYDYFFVDKVKKHNI